MSICYLKHSTWSIVPESRVGTINLTFRKVEISHFFSLAGEREREGEKEREREWGTSNNKRNI